MGRNCSRHEVIGNTAILAIGLATYYALHAMTGDLGVGVVVVAGLVLLSRRGPRAEAIQQPTTRPADPMPVHMTTWDDLYRQDSKAVMPAAYRPNGNSTAPRTRTAAPVPSFDDVMRQWDQLHGSKATEPMTVPPAAKPDVPAPKPNCRRPSGQKRTAGSNPRS